MHELHCQDALFSQFYANPLYLNPALAGNDDCARIMAGYRNQWPALDKNFNTYSLEADKYFKALSGGLGLTVFNDDAAGILNTLRVSGIYAYHLKLNRQTSLNAGLEAVFHQQKLNGSKLIFPDMINTTTGQVDYSGSGENIPGISSVIVPDFSTGLILGIAGKYYVGMAAHHLAQPDIGYYASAYRSTLYRKYSVHAGANFIIRESYFQNNKGQITFNPNILYQTQKNAQQVNTGFNITFYPLTTGVWYRMNFTNPDAMIFLIGLSQKKFRFGYSYDYSMSKLVGESGGAHEVSLMIRFLCGGKRNKPGAIKCPEF